MGQTVSFGRRNVTEEDVQNAQSEIVEGNLDFVRDFIDSNKLNLAKPDSVTAGLLTTASAWGKLPILEMLVAKGADVNYTDEYNHPPLYAAAESAGVVGNAESVQFLLDHGADVNIRTKRRMFEGETPLHAAAKWNDPEHIKAMKILIRNGADHRIPTPEGVLATEYDTFGKGNALKDIVENRTAAKALSYLSVASSNPANKLPELPHDVTGQVLLPFLRKAGPAPSLYPGGPKRVGKTGGRVRKSRRRRTLRKHK